LKLKTKRLFSISVCLCVSASALRFFNFLGSFAQFSRFQKTKKSFFYWSFSKQLISKHYREEKCFYTSFRYFIAFTGKYRFYANCFACFVYLISLFYVHMSVSIHIYDSPYIYICMYFETKIDLREHNLLCGCVGCDTIATLSFWFFISNNFIYYILNNIILFEIIKYIIICNIYRKIKRIWHIRGECEITNGRVVGQ